MRKAQREDYRLNKRLKKALDENKWTDIQFTVGEGSNVEVISAHRQIIAAASPAFEAMCFGDLAVGSKPVQIPDIIPEAFKLMLEYIYTDKVSLTSVETTCAVLYVAEKYIVENLISKCIDYLVANVTKQNAWYVLEHCYGKKDVVQQCTLVCDILSSPEFLCTSDATIINILDQEALNISSEVALLDACVRRAEELCKSRKMEPSRENLIAVLGPAISKIRFLTMTVNELVCSPGFNKLVTHADAYKIISNVVKPDSLPLPFDISKSRKIRSNMGVCRSPSYSNYCYYDYDSSD